MQSTSSNKLSLLDFKKLKKEMPFHLRSFLKSALNNNSDFLISLVQIGEECTGIALAKTFSGSYHSKNLELLWIYVKPEFRLKGCGLFLMYDLIQQFRQNDLVSFNIIYSEFEKHRLALESICDKAGFSSPKVNSFKMLVYSRKAFKAPWMKNIKLPKSLDVFLWKDLSAKEEYWLKEF
jgi:GNAT superfamily N-acetyltransferase